MNKLWARLAVAFILVTLVGVLVVGVLATREVSTQFRRYVVQSQMAGSTVVADLSDYYAATGSWAGVERVLEDQAGVPGMPNGMMGAGRGMRRGAPHLILADANGRIVYSSGGDTSGQLSRADTANATPIQVEGRVVGYLAFEMPSHMDLSASAQEFLGRINRALLQAGTLAVVLGIVMSLVIARGVSAPLGRLVDAAQRIAHGRLDERVSVKGPEEVTELAGAFNEMAASLEHAEDLRQNMVADIAHELRTPLSVLQGNLQAILDGVYPMEKGEIANIYDETIMLSRLVADLHELAQAEAGRLPLNAQPVELPPLVERVTVLFEEPAAAHDVTLDVSLPASLPAVHADPDRVRQVLHNLLANALRHTPAGGRIRVAVAQPTPEAVRVSVSDTGAGIPANDLPYVFDRFWRAEKSRSRDAGGSGLGLAIARQLVEAMGGEIGVESEPGAGSSFWFTLPTVKFTAEPLRAQRNKQNSLS